MKNMYSDRRQDRRRRSVEEHGIKSARVRPGHEVSLVDVSSSGALIEASHRLLPGSSIELQLAGGEERQLSLRGRVLRCSVTRLRAFGVVYRGAIVFDHHIPWLVDDDRHGYVVLSGEIRSSQRRRGDDSPSAR